MNAHVTRKMPGRGQATIVSALIMVLSSVMFSSVLLVWAYGFLGQGQSNFSQSLQRANTQAAELFVIEEVRFGISGTLQNITIYVRNGGDVPVRIAGVFLVDPNAGTVYRHCEIKPGDASLGSTDGIILPRSVEALPTIPLSSPPPPPPPPTGLSCTGTTAPGLATEVRIRLGSTGGNQIQQNFRVE